MRTLAFLICLQILATSCNNSTEENSTNADTTITDSTGANMRDNTSHSDTQPTSTGIVDAQGCKTEAGEKFSKVRKACVVVNNLDRMEASDASLDQTKPAYFLMDSVRVEIFLPTQENSVVIRRSGDTWTSGPLTFSMQNGKYRLEDEGKLLYQQQ